ncbi:helix-turn-helix domain-containing protein [Nesterenkonia populi]|uniref:helix-turn-helix domain-containing protein n=1 Tax=Nesterenkonia populi TaxID=1591087 RepID=UPI0011BE0F6A|nr:helix-turn-helix domain-containing protein [Nesterenkonia populi]
MPAIKSVTAGLPANSRPISVNTIDAARYLGVESATLAKWRSQGDGPPFVKINSKVLYRLDSLDEYLRTQEVRR